MPLYSKAIIDYTLALLPAANQALGITARITDLGTGSALFYSNGSYWLPCGEQLIYVDNVGATVTGTTTETVLSTFTMPKELASPNMTIVVNSLWSVNGNANIRTPRVRFGGVAGTEYVNPQISSNSTFHSECLIRFRNALNSQTGSSSTPWPSYSVVGGVAISSSLDMSVNDADIVLSGQLTNAADYLTLRAHTITLRG